MLKSIVLKSIQLALFSTCLTLTYSAKASAEVNVNLLNSVVESCKKYPPKDNSLFKISSYRMMNGCISYRYQYTLFMSKYNGLKNLENLRPDFLSSLAVFGLAYSGDGMGVINTEQFLDCMVSENKNSQLCDITFSRFSSGYYLSTSILASICSSCFEAYLNAGEQGLNTSIAGDFIKWFYKLDKPSRKLVVDAISDQNFMTESRQKADQAFELYDKIEEKLKREEQERRRQDLLN